MIKIEKMGTKMKVNGKNMIMKNSHEKLDKTGLKSEPIAKQKYKIGKNTQQVILKACIYC